MKSIRLFILKRQLRTAYIRYLRLRDSVSCGGHLADQLPSIAKAKAECNAILRKVAALDPEGCPISRIS